MNTGEIRTRLHEEIDAGDERLLKIIYAIVKEYNGTDIADERAHLIEERAKYLRGEGRSYSWDEVKHMAVNKKSQMKYRIEIRPLAVLEILDAYNWYEYKKVAWGRSF